MDSIALRKRIFDRGIRFNKEIYKINPTAKYRNSLYQNLIKKAIILPIERDDKTYTIVASRSHLSKETLDFIDEKWIEPFGGKITQFPMEKDSYNGAFQYTTSRDRSWFHVDSWNNWAGVLYMSPDAPVNGGTGLYRYKDGTRFEWEQKKRNNKKEMDTASQDVSKWELVDKVGNIFNRLVILFYFFC